MNFLSSIFNWFRNILRSPVTTAIIRAVLIEVIQERYGQAGEENKDKIFRDVVKQLRQQGYNVDKNYDLIATVLDKELDIEIKKKE